MARIAGVDIPNEKRIEISLRYIFGIGPKSASIICEKAGLDPGTKTRDVTDAELSRIREVLDHDFVVGPASHQQQSGQQDGRVPQAELGANLHAGSFST